LKRFDFNFFFTFESQGFSLLEFTPLNFGFLALSFAYYLSQSFGSTSTFQKVEQNSFPKFGSQLRLLPFPNGFGSTFPKGGFIDHSI